MNSEKNIKINFCTLFDSNYIDMGILMYESLLAHADNFHMYIIAMDKDSYNYLQSRKFIHMTVIDEQDILDADLRIIKENRTRAEYCWTCSSIGIKYCIEHYLLDNCTYVDADVFFYDNPRILIEEMLNNKCSAQIIPHRFSKSFENFLIRKTYGNFCVEFNTFLGDANGMQLLNWWVDRCKETCSISGINGTYGDQKYLDQFIKVSKKVNILANPFAGVAPWNLGQYTLIESKHDKIRLMYKDGRCSELIFYHFQNLKLLDENRYYSEVHTWNGKLSDERVVPVIYNQYVKKLLAIRKQLAKDMIHGECDRNNLIWNAKYGKRERTRIWMVVNKTIIAILGFRRRQKYKDRDIMTLE